MRIIAVVAILLISTSLAHALGTERNWQVALPGGGTEYVILHGDDDVFTVDTISEVPGKLPRKISTQPFKREAEALRFALREAGPRALEHWAAASTPAHSSPSAYTEVSGATLWSVTESWSWDWELRYDQWVKDQVTHTFFIDNQISTDCADVAFALRWIFARIHGLPAANRLAGSGVLFTQDSMQTEWLALPVDADWRKDMRFRAALDYVLQLTYTHSLLRDSYPIEISVASLLRGTHHLEIHGSSGHTYFVYRTDYSDTTTQPIEVMYSNTPKIVRELYHNGYWRNPQPKEGEGGFLRVRWPLRAPTEASGWALADPESHPHFSREQFTSEFMKDRTSFSEAVLTRLGPKLDFVERLREGIRYLKEQLKMRTDVVREGYELCQRVGCPDKSPEFDTWSTYSRDARFKEVFSQLELLVQNLSQSLPKLRETWDAALLEPAVILKGETYSLAEIVFAWNVHSYSSHPRDPLEARWGLAPQAFATAIGSKIDSLLAERSKRLGAQGSACVAVGSCAPGSTEWTSWSSFDVDAELRTASASLRGYCLRAPASRCEALQAAQQSVIAGTALGRPESLEQWTDLTFWLVSDPRTSAEVRWGANRAAKRSYVLKGPRYMEFNISATGLAAVVSIAATVSNPRNGEIEYPSDQVVDLITGREILPPRGMSWRGFDPKHDRAVVVPATLPEGAPLDIRVIEPRTGNSIFQASGFAASTSIEMSWRAPGLLSVNAPADNISFFDLRTQPVAEMRALPWKQQLGQLLKPFPIWFEGLKDGTYEILSVRGSKLSRQPVHGLFGAGDRPGFIFSTGGKFVLGAYFHCSDSSCHSSEYSGSFATNLVTGKTQLVARMGESFALTPDAKWAMSSSRSPGGNGVELLELGPELEVLSRRKIGVSVVSGQCDAESFCQGSALDAAGNLKMFRYEAGAWTELALLADEKELVGFEGDFVQTRTHQGWSRVRRFSGTQALFESEPGSQVMFIGTSNDGKSLPAILVSYVGTFEAQAIYALDRPEVPLITGSFKRPSENHLPMMEYSPVTETLVRARGLLLPAGDAVRIWIDN